ncbi:unnamed protein product [Scytosiphon promiscuus]
MSWAEGRAAAMPTGATDGRREALDRVDGLLRALAQDKNLQDDLKNKDVRKALHHWTGEKRLSEDEADELMEDNYRVQSVCSKMVELQSLCKQACIGLPLPRVLAGKGLYEQLEQAGGGLAQGSAAATSSGARGSGSVADQAAAAASPASRIHGSQGGASTAQRRLNSSQQETSSKETGQGASRMAGEGTSEEAGREDDPSWRQALIDEVLRLAGVCVCALVFTLLLKHYRGDDPLGKGLSGSQDPSAVGKDEL